MTRGDFVLSRFKKARVLAESKLQSLRARGLIHIHNEGNFDGRRRGEGEELLGLRWAIGHSLKGLGSSRAVWVRVTSGQKGV